MSRSKGFTIVELLVVIVVIGILATITIVSYSTAQARAKTASALTDLHNLGEQMEIFSANNGGYPTTAADVEQVVRAANLYSLTRLSAADEAAGKQAPRSFMFCIKINTQSYAIIAFSPVYSFLVANGASYVGKPLYYVSSEFSGTKTIQWDAARNTGSNMCVSVDASYDVAGNRFNNWAYNVPTANAP